jgi:hypothetical protein
MLGSKLDDNQVLQIAEAMAQPDTPIPMIVLQKPLRGNYFVCSGNHRFGGHRLALPQASTIDAYVVQIKDPLLLDIYCRVVNAWESGLGFSREERVMNARWLIENQSMKVAEAAALFNIKPNWIYQENSAAEVKKTLEGLGFSTNGLAKSTLRRLAAVSSNANVLRETTKLLLSHHVKGDEAYQVIEDVRRQSTELQQLRELARWEDTFQKRLDSKHRADDRSKGAKVRISATVRQTALRYISGLARLLEKHDTLEKLQISDAADLAILFRDWKAIKKTFAKLEGGSQ